MSGATNSVAPQGAGDKSVSHLNPDYDRDMTDDEVDGLTNTLGQVQRAQQRNLNHIEVPDDDKFYVEEPPTSPVTPTLTSSLTKRIAKAYSYVDSLTPTTKKLIYSISGVDEPIPTVPDPCASFVAPSVPSSVSSNTYTFMQSNTRIASSLKSTYEIPCPIIFNLTKVKVHIPLTVLTPLALRKIHQDPSCIKIMKGLVNDPKLSVMDATSSGFSPVTSLLADQFNEAFGNFIKKETILVKTIAPFLCSISRHAESSFNTLTFMDRPAYLDQLERIKSIPNWKTSLHLLAVLISNHTLLRNPTIPCQEGAHPLNDSNGKPFIRAKEHQLTNSFA
ncbi:hypothetical protein DFJ58DRAFT_727467 [Suillus subalutaceus]|uniref:uncharacterized protein n=1 Tax=Suillus subalutaceus TaxID=48586 RepID=UPI001B885CF6|nr:uncharacterized protein DFJ58DRAFT_727467 [Suillus subalutaceus]KAG1855656.1 hypothetical protein DFJ58DRAFT_727467 [Suillus subalutaceus]